MRNLGQVVLRQFISLVQVVAIGCGAILIAGVADAQFMNPRYGRILPEWEKYYQAGLEAYSQDRFEEAERLFGKAREEVKKFGPNDRRMATVLNDLAKVYHAEGKYADAALLYR